MGDRRQRQPGLGILNESLCTDLPIIVAPYAKPALASHPAYHAHLAVLAGSGVRLTATEELRPLRDPCRSSGTSCSQHCALRSPETRPVLTPHLPAAMAPP